jgi:hypothetical protein
VQQQPIFQTAETWTQYFLNCFINLAEIILSEWFGHYIPTKTIPMHLQMYTEKHFTDDFYCSRLNNMSELGSIQRKSIQQLLFRLPIQFASKRL